jgi:hypothetical protein
MTTATCCLSWPGWQNSCYQGPESSSWGQAEVCSTDLSDTGQRGTDGGNPPSPYTQGAVPSGGHRPCCSLWPVCPHRLFDYRGRLSPVPVPRAVPVKRPRVTVPLVRRVKTTIPVKLFSRSTAITTGSAKIKCE